MNRNRKSQAQTNARALSDVTTAKTIPLTTLLTWLEEAAERYDYPEARKEHSSARRVIDRLHLQICERLYGKDFHTGYMFEHVDAAIENLREGR